MKLVLELTRAELNEKKPDDWVEQFINGELEKIKSYYASKEEIPLMTNIQIKLVPMHKK